MPYESLLVAVLALPFVGSCLAALFEANARNAEAWLAGAVALTCLALLAAGYPRITDGGVIRHTVEWVPELGLEFSLRLDGFAWMFAMLVTGIGFLVVLYARYYMSPADPVPRFFSFLLAFMGAMLGIVLSGNLIQLVFFWELTSLFSFLLIGYWHQNAQARDGARMALTVTSAGGLCLFAGVLVVGHIVGSYDLDRVLASGEVDPLASPLRSGPDPRPARRAHEERAVPVPFLAAARHGGADARLGLPAFGHHGEGRRLPADPAVAGAGRDRRMAVARGLGRPDHLHPRRLHRRVPAGPEGPAGLLDDQPSRADHAADRARHPARPGRRDLPHHEPRDLQGVAVHGRRHHRSRNRHARHPAPERPVAVHADHGDAGHGRRRRHGGRSAAERIPVQGDVLRRDHRDPRQLARRSGASLHRHPGQHVHGRLFAALHPRRVLRPRSDRPAAHAARAAVPDAAAGRAPRAGLPRRRHRARRDGRPGSRHGGACGPRPGDPRLQPRVWHGFTPDS